MKKFCKFINRHKLAIYCVQALIVFIYIAICIYKMIVHMQTNPLVYEEQSILPVILAVIIMAEFPLWIMDKD